MSNTLNYRGDHTDIDRDKLLGPDLHGAFYRPVSALYNPQTDMTKVKLQSGSLAGLLDKINEERNGD